MTEEFFDSVEDLGATVLRLKLAWQAGITYQNAYLHGDSACKARELEQHAIILAAQIRERERTERERIGLERQLLAAQKMAVLGTLAGGMAHDINNCLVPILSLTELLSEMVPAGSRERNCIAMIGGAGERIRDLVRRILVFSRREEVAHSPIDLAVILKESVKLLRAALPATIALRSRTEPDAAIIEGDAGQVQQVLLNLCVNAADALGDGGGVIEIALDTVDLEKALDAIDGTIAPGRYYRLRAADNGSGMDDAVVARIFEPLFTTKESGKRTGLGLAMVHRIVASHSGHLMVSSRLGAGTTFDIYLPVSARLTKEC
jgi:signal transduction histidine kinase